MLSLNRVRSEPELLAMVVVGIISALKLFKLLLFHLEYDLINYNSIDDLDFNSPNY